MWVFVSFDNPKKKQSMKSSLFSADYYSIPIKPHLSEVTGRLRRNRRGCRSVLCNALVSSLHRPEKTAARTETLFKIVKTSPSAERFHICRPAACCNLKSFTNICVNSEHLQVFPPGHRRCNTGFRTSVKISLFQEPKLISSCWVRHGCLVLIEVIWIRWIKASATCGLQ